MDKIAAPPVPFTGQFGVPYCLKIDIEGADLCLEELLTSDDRPNFTAIER